MAVCRRSRRSEEKPSDSGFAAADVDEVARPEVSVAGCWAETIAAGPSASTTTTTGSRRGQSRLRSVICVCPVQSKAAKREEARKNLEDVCNVVVQECQRRPRKTTVPGVRGRGRECGLRLRTW